MLAAYDVLPVQTHATLLFKDPLKQLGHHVHLPATLVN